MKERGHGKIGLCRRLTGSAWNMKERLSWTHVIASRHFRAGAFVERSQDIQSSGAARKGSFVKDAISNHQNHYPYSRFHSSRDEWVYESR